MASSLLYVTQAEPHDITRRRAPLTSPALRAYLMLYGMFFDQLMASDSQFINNASLRSLLWSGEPSADPNLPSDLAVLVDRKVLVPAIRDSVDTLGDVRRDLDARRVVGVGSERYVDFVDGHLRRRGIAYNAAAVSTFFRDQVLATFSSDNADLYLKGSIRRAVFDYVSQQDVLHYIRLRQWMAAQIDAGRMSTRHRAVIEHAVAAAYRYNVPKAIKGSSIDVPLDPNQLWTPIDIQLGNKRVADGSAAGSAEFPIRPFAVSTRVLSRLPAEALLEIRREPTRRPVMRLLEDFCRTGDVDAQRLAADLEIFLHSAERIAYAAATGESRELIKRRRRSAAAAHVTLTRDVGLAVAGLSIWGAVGNIAGYVGLAVTAYASIHALRDRGNEYRRGYAVGRAIPDEHRLLLPDRSGIEKRRSPSRT